MELHRSSRLHPIRRRQLAELGCTFQRYSRELRSHVAIGAFLAMTAHSTDGTPAREFTHCLIHKRDYYHACPSCSPKNGGRWANPFDSAPHPFDNDGMVSLPNWTPSTKPARKLTREEQTKIDELAMYFFEGSGDAQAVSWSLRNVILARFEWAAKHGKDSGE